MTDLEKRLRRNPLTTASARATKAIELGSGTELMNAMRNPFFVSSSDGSTERTKRVPGAFTATIGNTRSANTGLQMKPKESSEPVTLFAAQARKRDTVGILIA
jgi:hypothetical protein